MAAKLLHKFYVCITITLLAIPSYAGIERFWTLKDDPLEEPMNECESLTKEQQHQLINTYQAIRDEEKKLDLKKRMEWFCQLADDEQQRMRLAWQNMSTQERNLLKKKLQATTDNEQRNQIRREFLEKYHDLN